MLLLERLAGALLQRRLRVSVAQRHCPAVGAGQPVLPVPQGSEIVAYCRGPYCVYADEAVRLLTDEGRRSVRLEEGFPEWKAAGLPIEKSAT